MEQLINPVYLGLIIAALGLLTAVIVPIAIHLREKSKKELTYSVFDDVPLLNIQEAVKENFQVLYRGQPIPDARFISVMVWNSGDIPIEHADFVTPLKLDFGNDSDIFFAVTTTWPTELLTKLNNSKEKNYVEFKPLLMNKGSLFSVSVMVANFRGSVKVEGLIKGVKIRNASPESNALPKYWKPIFLTSLVMTTLIGALGLLISFDYLIRPSYFINSLAHVQSQLSLYTFILFLIIILAVFITISIWLSPKITPFQVKHDVNYLKRVFSLLPSEAEVNQAIDQYKKPDAGQRNSVNSKQVYNYLQDKK